MSKKLVEEYTLLVHRASDLVGQFAPEPENLNQQETDNLQALDAGLQWRLLLHGFKLPEMLQKLLATVIRTAYVLGRNGNETPLRSKEKADEALLSHWGPAIKPLLDKVRELQQRTEEHVCAYEGMRERAFVCGPDDKWLTS
jgi:hypothetical protein